MNKKDVEFQYTGLEIAVIGMSGRYPGASNLDRFWENLSEGVESVVFSTPDEKTRAGIDERMKGKAEFIYARGAVLKDAYCFDAAFFDYVPSEAEALDPQVRLFHECVWEAMEHAGYIPDAYPGTAGVYAGASMAFMFQFSVAFSTVMEQLGEFSVAALSNRDFMSSRVSYKLGLKGPSFTMNTACSTGLVAVDLACRGILTGQCTLAIVGGVGLHQTGKMGYVYQEGMIGSDDGHCRPFDSRAKGTIGGEGIGVAVLKLLEEALEDGDTIHAVIKGSAVNNDGGRKVGYTAPSVSGQAEVIRLAHHQAEIEAETIGYVETHGTATPLGDPVEIEALKQGFNTDKKAFCPIGSVKSNIGHLDAGAGMAGFIKTVLILKHQMIPPSLHYTSPNPAIDFANGPFYVNRGLTPWERGDYPLRAGVSSFGIGGTNAHIVLEEAPPLPGDGQERPSREQQLLLLSARTPSALETMSKQMAAFLTKHPDISLADTAFTLKTGRKAMEYRRMTVCSTVNEAAEQLAAPPAAPVPGLDLAGKPVPLVFMFPGLGAQYLNMGKDLYLKEPVFRKEMDRCFGILDSLTALDLPMKEILYPAGAGNGLQVDVAQPLLFAVEYALARLVMKWGLRPKAVIGYSFGEYTAACIAGVIGLEDVLRLIVERGKLLKKVPAGAMLSVPLPAPELEPLLPPDGSLSLAIDNGPSCIVAGEETAVAKLEAAMKERRLLTMRLANTHAMHSHMMEPVLNELERVAATFKLSPPEIPMISNVTGGWLDAKEACDPGYWSRHLRGAVRFAAGVKELLKDRRRLFVEAGPGRDLSPLLTRHLETAVDRPEGDNRPRVVNLVRPEAKQVSDTWYLLNKLGWLWLSGAQPDWSGFYGEENRRRIPLPVYPFEGQYFRVYADPKRLARSVGLNAVPAADTGSGHDRLHRLCYFPAWKRTLLTNPGTSPGDTGVGWLVFNGSSKLGGELAAGLEQKGHRVISVQAAEKFSGDINQGFHIDPAKPEHYRRLFSDLAAADRTPNRVLHLWSLNRKNSASLHPDPQRFEKIQESGLYSVMNIIHQFHVTGSAASLRLEVVTGHMQDVSGEEDIQPEHSTLRGLLKVIPKEYPHIRCRLLDVAPAGPGNATDSGLTQQVLEEILPAGDISEPEVAFRGPHRWVPEYLPLEPVKEEDLSPPLKRGGSYLITGGLGEIGLILAEYLAKEFSARLILTGRSTVPPRRRWRGKFQKLLDIETAYDTEIIAAQCDVADQDEMGKLVSQAGKRFGGINGVIHAAGEVDPDTMSILSEMDRDGFREQFRAKVTGTMVLARLFSEGSLDFVWLMSSLASMTGVPRLSAYASANAFMDSFAEYMRRVSPVRWVSVNWEGIAAPDTVKCFKWILSHPRVYRAAISSEEDLNERIRRWVKQEEPPEPGKAGETGKPRPLLMNPYVPPETRIQSVIAGVWKTVFGYAEVGLDDDFFELGGDSLKAIVMINKLHPLLGVLIPLEQVFKTPTIRLLSRELETGAMESSEYVNVDPAETREYYPVSPLQRRIFVLDGMDAAKTPYNLPALFKVKGDLDTGSFQEVFQRLIRRHESLRTSFHLREGEVVQKIHEELDFSMSRPEGENPEKLIAAFVRPFDLGQAPLLRAAVTRLAEQEYLLMFDMHHIISDGTSMGILIREFMTLYDGGRLQTPGLQYKDFALWLHGSKGKEVLKKQQEYWLKRFSGTPPRLNLFTDFPRPSVQSFEGGVTGFNMNPEQVAAVKELAGANGATLYMILLAAFNVMLFHYTGQSDIVVGTPVAGRAHEGFQSIIGMFINTLPLRNFPRPNMTFQSFLAEVKEDTLAAYENQAYPFGDLVEQLGLDNDISRNPLYDVELVLQNTDMEPLRIEGLEFTPLGHDTESAQVDISVYADEIGDYLRFTVNYCSRLYKLETIQRMMAFYRRILETVASSPTVTLAEIDSPRHIESADTETYAPEDSEFEF